MEWYDAVLLALIAGALPVKGVFEIRRLRQQVAAGQERARLHAYARTFVILWAGALLVVGIWFAAGRPLSTLGLGWQGGLGVWGSAGIAAAIMGFLLWQAREVQRHVDAQAQLRETLGDLTAMMPRTRRELAAFYRLSLTAGITEEIIERGFLIWLFTPWIGTLGAVLASSAIFGLGHTYQGLSGILKTGAVGLVLAGLYVWSGSLWIPMLLHAGVDMVQGRMIWGVLRETPEPAA